MSTYTEDDQRADTAFLIGARYSRDVAVNRLPDVLNTHQPGDDWHCKCGEECFGGTAAYSWQLYLAHVADCLHAAIQVAR